MCHYYQVWDNGYLDFHLRMMVVVMMVTWPVNSAIDIRWVLNLHILPTHTQGFVHYNDPADHG